MPATNPLPPVHKTAADNEAAKLLSQRTPKSAPAKTSSNGSTASRVAGTKVSGRGVTRTRGGSV